MYEILNSYISANYTVSVMDDKIDTFIRDLKQNRDVIYKMPKISDSQEQLTQNKTILIAYINQILALRSKMTFGKEEYSCKIKFKWTDTIEGKEWSSYNINFEFYNVLFNLATVFYCLGIAISNRQSKTIDKNVKKEASKNLRNSLYCFRVIKNEAYSRISKSELPYDLYPRHIEYIEQLCTIAGQNAIVEISSVTSKSQFGLQAGLLLCAADCYYKAYEQSKHNPTIKCVNEQYQNYLLNRNQYYVGLMYEKLKQGAMYKFDQTGTGYGDALYFQGKFVEQIMKAGKNAEQCGNYLNREKFEKRLKAEQKIGQELLDMNTRIYHQAIPREGEHKVEYKNLMTPLLPDELFLGKNRKKAKEKADVYCPGLDMLMNNQAKDMITRYKNRMAECLNQKISLCESERTINSFLYGLRLPPYFLERSEGGGGQKDSIDLPPQLWSKIYHTQQMGGTMALNGMMDRIMQKSDFLMNNLQNTLNSFANEERDDNEHRNRYGSRWIRKSSSSLNSKFVGTIQNYINGLNNTRTFDMKQKNDIMNNARFFEILGNSKDKLVEDIPGRVSEQKYETSDEQKLREEILKLYEQSDKCMEIIDPLFEQLNEDSVILSLFIEVIDKTTTEQAIFMKSKEDCEKKIKELEDLSQDVRKQKQVVGELAQKIAPSLLKRQKDNMDGNSGNKEALDYFRMLDSHANAFMNCYEKIKKGENYYNGLEFKINEVLNASNKWMINRNEEKNALIATINMELGGEGSAGGSYDPSSTYLDAGQNLYTNMKVTGYGNRGGY